MCGDFNADHEWWGSPCLVGEQVDTLLEGSDMVLLNDGTMGCGSIHLESAQPSTFLLSHPLWDQLLHGRFYHSPLVVIIFLFQFLLISSWSTLMPHHPGGLSERLIGQASQAAVPII